MKVSRDKIVEEAVTTGFLSFPPNPFGAEYAIPLSKIVSWVNSMCRESWPLYIFADHKIKSVSMAEIQEMRKRGLLVLRRHKSGRLLYAGLNAERILFIKLLWEKCDMSDERIYQIIDFETRGVIRVVVQREMPQFGNRSVLSVFRKGAHHMIEIKRRELRAAENMTEERREIREEQIQELGDLLTGVNGKRWQDLGPEEARRIASWALQFVYQRQFRKWLAVALSRDRVLQGYSPQVVFSSYSSSTTHHMLSPLDIDWRNTLRGVRVTPWLTYLRTPSFELEIVKKAINIRVFCPQNVEAKSMRQIGKIYTLFRERLNPARAAWGTKKGTRKYYESRNRFLIDQDAVLRQHLLGLDKRLEKLHQALLQKDFHGISKETIKKILYKGRKQVQ